MQYILLTIVVFMVAAQNIAEKQYNVKVQNGNAFLLAGLSSLVAMAFFVLCSGFRFSFEWGITGYSLAFAVSYALANLGIVLAIRHGSLGITMLIYSYSLIIPTFYGVIALNEPVTMFTILGLILLAVALFLLNFKNETIKVSLKWLGFMLMAFMGNGMCSTIQKIQQSAFNGGYKNEFMILALFVAGVFLILLSKTGQKGESPKKTMPYAACRGIANGIVNLLVMVLTGLIPNVILFPVISAGGIVLGFFAAVFVYKERLSLVQYIGYAVGVASVVILNL